MQHTSDTTSSGATFDFDDFIGSSAPMRALYAMIAAAAGTPSSVLVTGESGTGKDLTAQSLHRHSPRAHKPFVRLNCATLTPELIDSEIFGHRRGAFTGAVSDHIGLLARAEGGTLFLDEITELPLHLQAKLLHVLDNGHYRRMGDSHDSHADVRIIAATNADIATALQQKRLHADLYYRIGGLHLPIPALRARGSADIVRLAQYQLSRISHASLSEDAQHWLAQQPWYGNVRELGNDAAELIADQDAYLKSQQEQFKRDVAVIDDQIRQKEAELAGITRAATAADRNAQLVARTLESRRVLNRDGVLSSVKLNETEQRHNEATADAARLRSDANSTRAVLAELSSRKTALLATRTSDAHRELDGVLAQSGENRELIAKLQARLENLLVTAPVAGMVQGLNVQLRGSVIAAAQPIMEIVPVDDALAVTLRVRPADIGHLRAGQRVQVKVSSFDFARFGAASGRLHSLSPSTFEGAQGERFYEGSVVLDQPYVGTRANRILPGMTVMADIITGEKTIMSYLLKPLQSAVATAFSER